MLTSTGLQDTTSTGLSESYGPTAQDVDEKLQGLRTGEGRKTGYWEAGTGMVFDPDRWMTKEGLFDPLAGPGGYPFGLGPRACFGKNLAVSEWGLCFLLFKCPDITLTYFRYGNGCLSG